MASALGICAHATRRKRRMPSDQMRWEGLGMAWFCDELVHEGARRLNICTQRLASD
ncbi:MAG: transposase domain-containing protein [Alphaproteobacteria bacterium]|nr:transposase domain-containing protein [Alphaproteobacteria bacterium]